MAKSKIKKFNDFDISKEDFTECFQDFFDTVSNEEIDVFVFDGKSLFVTIVHDDIVDDGGNSVSGFRTINKSQSLLISCLDRFTSMHDCKITEIDWSSNEISLNFSIKNESEPDKKGITTTDICNYITKNDIDSSSEEIIIIYQIGGKWKYDPIDTIQILKDRNIIKIKEHGSQITNWMIKKTVDGDWTDDDIVLNDWEEDYPQLEFKVKRDVGRYYVNNELYLSYKGIHKVIDIISSENLTKKKIKGLPREIGEPYTIILVCE